MRRTARGIVAFLLLVGLSAAAASARCSVRIGARVALYGSTGDPDVLVWETRFRLAAYQRGSFDVDRTLLSHAHLAAPGTRAVVLRCVSRDVHPKYRGTVGDAIYIRLLGGPYRRQTGWIMGSDLRTMIGFR
ncbi:MAG TPA: hypothetical protein VIJ12_01100 [Candidatus Baltobacteraceae bacterium]